MAWIEKTAGGNGGVSNTLSTPVSAPRIANVGGTLYVAYIYGDIHAGSEQCIYVKKWDGVNWVEATVGSASGGGISGSGRYVRELDVCNRNGALLCVWTEDTNKDGQWQLQAKVLSGGTWSTFAVPDQEPGLAIMNLRITAGGVPTTDPANPGILCYTSGGRLSVRKISDFSLISWPVHSSRKLLHGLADRREPVGRASALWDSVNDRPFVAYEAQGLNITKRHDASGSGHEMWTTVPVGSGAQSRLGRIKFMFADDDGMRSVNGGWYQYNGTDWDFNEGIHGVYDLPVGVDHETPTIMNGSRGLMGGNLPANFQQPLLLPVFDGNILIIMRVSPAEVWWDSGPYYYQFRDLPFMGGLFYDTAQKRFWQPERTTVDLNTYWGLRTATLMTSHVDARMWIQGYSGYQYNRPENFQRKDPSGCVAADGTPYIVWVEEAYSIENYRIYTWANTPRYPAREMYSIHMRRFNQNTWKWEDVDGSDMTIDWTNWSVPVFGGDPNGVSAPRPYASDERPTITIGNDGKPYVAYCARETADAGARMQVYVTCPA